MTAPEVGHVRDLEPELPTEPEGVEAFIAENSDARHVRLYRIGGDGARELLETLPASGFLWDAVRSRYGGGRFQAKVMSERHNYMKSETMRISGPSRTPAEAAADQDDDDDDPGAGRLEEVMGSIRRLEGIVRELRNPPPQAHSAPPVDMATSIVTAVQSATMPLITALIEARSPKPTPQGTSIEDMVSLLKMGVSLGRQGRGGSDDGKASVAARALDEVGVPMVRWLMSQNAGAAGVAEQRAGPPSPPPPPWVPVVAPWVESLVPVAEADRRPEVYAELILDHLDGPQLVALELQLSRGPQWRGEFFHHFPAAAAHGAWFGELFDCFAELLLAGENEDGEDANGGNGGNP